MEELETKLRDMVDTFNRRADKDEKMQKELEGMEKSIQIDVEEGSYKMFLRDLHLQDMGAGTIEGPDILITTDSATMIGIINKEIKPMKAYATKKIKLKASLQDLIVLKSVLK